MLRLFVAITPPPVLCQRLALFGGGMEGARWVEPRSMHVTLRFIGEIDEARAQGVDLALSAIEARPFHVEISGFGLFTQGRRPSTLWAGIERSPPLLHLRDKIESVLVRNGLEPERRKYQPHLTLARLSRETPETRIQDFLAGNNLYRTGFEADSFSLFSSHHGNGAPLYVEEARYCLQEQPSSWSS